MGKRHPPPNSEAEKSAALQQAVQQGRARAEQLLEARRQHLARLESTLTSQIEHWVTELANGQDSSQQAHAQLEQRLAQLRQHEELLANEVTQLNEARVELELSRDEFSNDRTLLSRRSERLEERERQFEGEQLRLEQSVAETKAQRRRLAAEFRAQRAAWQGEQDAQRRELERLRNRERLQAEDEVASLEQELAQVRQQLAQSRQTNDSHSADQFRGRDEFERLQRDFAEREEQLHRARAALEVAIEDQRRYEESRTQWEAEKAAWQRERSELEQKWAEGAKGPVATEDSQRRQDDLQRRFEMAVQDVRELKRKNADLEERLQEVQATGTAPKPASGKLDWEAQKKRLLSLWEEAETGENQTEDRLTLEGAIHITDSVVAQKDGEIAELKVTIANLEAQLRAGPAVDPELTAFVDRDAAVQAERERLLAVQEEWREKVKQAEVDISLERAKIARDRADIEEKLRMYEQDKARQVANGEDPTTATTTKKPARGRWLTRLGLKDDGNG